MPNLKDIKSRISSVQNTKKITKAMKMVAAAKVKLERSLATNKILHVGDVITENDLHMLSPGDGYKWAQKDEVIGKTVTVEIPKDEVIYPNMIKQ